MNDMNDPLGPIWALPTQLDFLDLRMVLFFIHIKIMKRSILDRDTESANSKEKKNICTITKMLLDLFSFDVVYYIVS